MGQMLKKKPHNSFDDNNIKRSFRNIGGILGILHMRIEIHGFYF